MKYTYIYEQDITNKQMVDIYPFRGVGMIKFGFSRAVIRNNTRKQNVKDNKETPEFGRVTKRNKAASDNFDSYSVYYEENNKCNRIDLKLGGAYLFRLRGKTFGTDYVANKKIMMQLDRDVNDNKGALTSNKYGVTLNRNNTLTVVPKANNMSNVETQSNQNQASQNNPSVNPNANGNNPQNANNNG